MDASFVSSSSSSTTLSFSLMNKSLESLINSSSASKKKKRYKKRNVRRQQHSELIIGDRVRVLIENETRLFKLVQQGHGGWSPAMSDVMGRDGVIHRVTSRGDFRVEFNTRHGTSVKWTLNGHALNLVKQEFYIGQRVRVNPNEIIVRHLIARHGDIWNDQIRQILGHVCLVKQIDPAGLKLHLQSTTNSVEFKLPNQLCYSTRVDINASLNLTRSESVYMNISQLTTSMNTTAVNLIKYAACGNLNKVKKLIQSDPGMVNELYDGKPALHASSFHGHIDIVEFLIKEAHADMEIRDLDGDTALHFACFNGQSEVVELLLESGMQVNSVNKNGSTPLHVAVNKLHVDCVDLLMRYNCDLNVTDVYGDTPLHDIISKSKKLNYSTSSVQILNMLLDCDRINVEIVNKADLNAFHHACIKGNGPAIRKIADKFDMVDSRKSDGFTGLHLTVLNEHLECARLLIQDYGADVNAVDKRNCTPLHLATTKMNLSLIELLVENGADVNRRDEEGDSCLHIILNDQIADTGLNLRRLSECKHIAKIAESIPDTTLRFDLRVILAVYLLRHGAELNLINLARVECIDYVKDKRVKSFLLAYSASLKISTESLNMREIKCKICDEEPRRVIFMPCRHKLVCNECSVRMKKCPECDKKIERKLVSSLKPAAATINTGPRTLLDELVEKINKLEEAQTCSICMERKKDTAFQCGHLFCQHCTHSLAECPVCRQDVEKRIRIFEN